MLKLARPGTEDRGVRAGAGRLLSGNEWKPHKIQGWTPDFVGSVVNREVYDRILLVDETVARDTARELATKEGIFCGISSGATFAAALEVARELPAGGVVLAMLPDTGERYLSTFLFEGVNEGSDDEWLASLEAGRG
jgi:cysteine synthase A